jgi:TPP-dependent 2-oxoacid decarboxylase
VNTQTAAQPGFPKTAAPTTVADYLLTRLSQAGVISVFGVPGDHNLRILDAVAANHAMTYQGMASELGAGYAADSYARLRGLGAVVTTFGVGELSAINAIAGAYAESVPVVHIVGTPALTTRNTEMTLHHNLPGGDFGHFARMAAEVTAAQTDLRPATATAEIDRVLRVAALTSRPVYIAIPADVAVAPVPAPKGRLPRVGEVAETDPNVLAAFAGHVRSVLDMVASASVLLGHLAARYRVTSAVRDLVSAGGLPVAVLSSSKGDFPESDPRFAGLYAGAASAKRTRVAVEDADVLITVGVTLSDTVTGGGTHQLAEDRRIDLGPDQARVGGVVYPGVSLREGLAIVTTAVRGCAAQLTASLLPAEETDVPAKGTRLTQGTLWASLQRFLEPGDTLVADQGTAFYGTAGLTLPAGTQLLAQPTWASIGWAAPAAVGATLGAPDRRLILVTGDGALQQTAGELGTLLALGAAPIVIVLNNGGYTTERAIDSPSACYHDIPAWNWTAMGSAVSPAMPPVAHRATSPRALDRALRSASEHAGQPIVIEAVLDREDTPPLLTDLTRARAARACAH